MTDQQVSEQAMCLRPVLEVIDRDHECADTYAMSRALALGLAVEKRGKLYLTRLGKRELTR